MDRPELVRRLHGFEWNDIEFKRARRGVPDDAYKTVSAFANTSGGFLVFGIQESPGKYEISGVYRLTEIRNSELIRKGKANGQG